MLHEYAVDPSALKTFNEIWQALEQFGVAHGRLLVECPKGWWGIVKRQLQQAEGQIPDTEYKTLEERCFRLKEKRKLIRRRNLKFDNNQKTWLESLHPEHRDRPFHAVLQSEPDHSDVIPVLSRYDLHDGNPLWHVERSVVVPRTDHDLARAVVPLLRISTDFLLVDPYFAGDPRHCSTFRLMLSEALRQGATFDRVEIHSKQNIAADLLKSIFSKYVVARIDACPDIEFFKWKPREGDERLHDRFVLTDRGGVEIPGGADEGESGQTTDVHLLDDSAFEFRYLQYQEESAAFELVERIRISGC